MRKESLEFLVQESENNSWENIEFLGESCVDQSLKCGIVQNSCTLFLIPN